MKKRVLFLIPLAVVTVLLFLLCLTGMKAHIAVSVIGLIALVAYTISTRKTWKCNLLEIFTRIFYAVALITGIVMMNVHGVAAISVIHKVSAVLFAVILIVCEVHKSIKK